MLGAREVLVEVAVVDLEGAVAGADDDAGDGALALAGGLDPGVGGHGDRARRRSPRRRRRRQRGLAGARSSSSASRRPAPRPSARAPRRSRSARGRRRGRRPSWRRRRRALAAGRRARAAARRRPARRPAACSAAASSSAGGLARRLGSRSLRLGERARSAGSSAARLPRARRRARLRVGSRCLRPRRWLALGGVVARPLRRRSGALRRRPGHLLTSMGCGCCAAWGCSGAGVDLELEQLLAGQLVAGEHPLDGAADHVLGLAVEHLLEGPRADPAGVAAVPVVALALQLVAGDGDLLGVDDDDEVADVAVRRVLGLALAAQSIGDLGREPAQGLALGVDDVPVARGGSRVLLRRSSCAKQPRSDPDGSRAAGGMIAIAARRRAPAGHGGGTTPRRHSESRSR